MILTKTCYKIYNIEFLLIIEVFKTWWYHLNNCKYNIFILTNYNSLYLTIDIKLGL